MISLHTYCYELWSWPCYFFFLKPSINQGCWYEAVQVTKATTQRARLTESRYLMELPTTEYSVSDCCHCFFSSETLYPFMASAHNYTSSKRMSPAKVPSAARRAK